MARGWVALPGSLCTIGAAHAKKLDPRLGHPVVDAYARRGRRAVELPLSRGNRIEQCVPMAKFDSPYDRVRKLPKQFKPLRAYEEERPRGVGLSLVGWWAFEGSSMPSHRPVGRRQSHYRWPV
jgi:hypothetical protein